MARGIERIAVPPPIDSDPTVRAIAKVLLESARYRSLQSDLRSQVAGLTALLEPWGVSEQAVRMALGLAYTDSGRPRGTKHQPNARLLYGARNEGVVTAARDTEVYMRATYLANAAKRMQRSLDKGESNRDAMRHEAVYYRAHEKARRQRLEAAAQIQVTGKVLGQRDDRGLLLGWYHNPLLNNDAECRAASGHNFYVEEGTVIGLPGSVHPGCGCYAGPAHAGASLVNEAVANIVKVRRIRPQFKLKTGKRRASA